MKVATDGYPVVNYWYIEQPNKTPMRSALRAYLIETQKICYWCKRECNNDIPLGGQKTNPLLGTVDHLIGRGESGKWRGVVPKVLACYECNSKRSIAQNPNHPSFRKTYAKNT